LSAGIVLHFLPLVSLFQTASQMKWQTVPWTGRNVSSLPTGPAICSLLGRKDVICFQKHTI